MRYFCHELSFNTKKTSGLIHQVKFSKDGRKEREKNDVPLAA
jgi:hypothetical protein